ncbi:MAG: hypothetical protein ABWK53_05235 [Anaerolineales bacterium]
MRKQTFLFLMLALSLALVLSACNLNFNTNVQQQGSGSLRVEIGYTPEELEDWWEEPVSAIDFCEDVWVEEDIAAELPAGATIQVERRGAQIWCIVEIPFSNLRQLKDLYEDVLSIDVDRLEIVNETFYCDMTWDLRGLQDESSYPIEAVFRLTTPGRVSATNADVRSGRTLTWHLNEDGENAILAISSIQTSDWVWWLAGALFCLCLGVLLTGGLIGLVLYLRKRKS